MNHPENSENDPAGQPPSGLYPGAVDQGNGRVTFAIYAPGKTSVSLIGEFNGWDRHANPLRVTDEGLWWTEKQFPPGQYTYQFAVDVDGPEGETVICDPYARALADDSAYDPPRALLEVGRAAFAWQHDDWPRPAFRDLVLYELHVGDFTPEGSFAGVSGRLDYLRELGVNCIELMPIFEFKGDLGWGYDPAYFFTVEKSYGEPDELRQLIDDAHAHGIAVILDLVLAHTAHRHPFNKLYPYDQSPWYGAGCGEENQFGFPTLDYRKGPAQDFARDVQAYWLSEYHVDGFRYDYCVGIGCCGDLGMPSLTSAARSVRPDAYLTGEYSPEEPDEIAKAGLDGGWHVGGGYGIKALLCQGECGDFNWDDFERCVGVLNPWESGYSKASEMVNYLESHDEQRTVYDMLSCGADKSEALARSALGATILLTMPGEPMLYHGQEFGEGTPRKTNERNTLHWEQLEKATGKALLSHFRRLIAIRAAHQALRSETYQLDALYPEQKAVVYHRWSDDGDEVVVAANFNSSRQVVRIPFPRPAKWCDEISGHMLEIESEFQEVELEGMTGAVYVKTHG